MPKKQTNQPGPQIVAPSGGGESGGSAGAAVTNAVDNILGDLNPNTDPDNQNTPAPVQDEPAPAPVQDEPAPAPVQDEPAPAPVQDEPAPAPVQDSPVPIDVLSGGDPAPAAPETPEEDDDDVETPESVKGDEKANQAWIKVKSERKELRNKVKSQEAELERLRTQQTPDLEEVLELRKQIDGYEAQLGQLDLASTKAFKERFDAPMDQTLRKGVSVLVQGGKDTEDAAKLMKQLVDGGASFEEIQGLIQDEPFPIQGSLVGIVAEYNELKKQRDESLDHWKDTRAALGEQAVRESEIKLMEDIEQDTQAALVQAVKEGNWMFGTSQTNKEWNQQVAQRTALVKGIVRNAKGPELVKWIIEGVTAKPLRDMFNDAHKRNLDLQTELNKVVGAAPNITPGATVPEPTPQVAKSKPRDPNELMDDIFKDDPNSLRFG